MKKLTACALSLLLLASCQNQSKDNNTNTTATTESAADTNRALAVMGLAIPQHINLSNANTERTNGSTINTQSLKPIAALSTHHNDYENDSVYRYTTTAALSNLDHLNQILCFLDKLDATGRVNQEAYHTALPGNECSDTTDDIQGDDLQATVLSTREDNDSPHNIKLWLTLPDPDMNAYNPMAVPATVLAETNIYESANENNPLGVFDFDYKIVVDASLFGGTLGQEMDYFIGKAQTSRGDNDLPKLALKVTLGAHMPYIYNFASITQLGDSSGLQAKTRFHYQYDYMGLIEEYEYSLDYNGSFALSYNAYGQGNDVCYSRNDYSDLVHGYNLYHNQDTQFDGQTVTKGQRVTLNNNKSLSFNYTHSAANDRNNTDPTDNPHHGLNYTLVYDGPGRLWGLPWLTDNSDNYYKGFDLADGTVLSNNDGEFIVKAVNIIHDLKTTELNSCQGLEARPILDDLALDPKDIEATTGPNMTVSDRPF